MSSGSGAVPGSAPPTAWAIRPQFGSPPCSAVLTSGELATARAARLDRARRGRRARRRGRRAGRPRRRATISSASWRSSASSASPKRSSSSALGLDATPDAPQAIRIAVSLVDSWPSTEMRSNERLTHTPSSRSAVSGASAASVCTKHSIVAKRGEIIPAPLAWAARRTRAARQLDLERRALLERVGGHDRLGERLVAVGTAAAPRGRRQPLDDRSAVERHADHAGGGDGDLLGGRRQRHRGGALHARRLVEPGRPVAALALPELATTARSASSCARSWRTSTGAASTPERGEARGARRSRARRRRAAPTSRAAAGLDARRRTPAARKPAGSPPRPPRATCAGTSTQREREEAGVAVTQIPSALVEAEHQVQALHRLRRGRPSRGCRSPRTTSTLPVRWSRCTWMRQKFVSRTSRTPGGAVDELDERLVARRRCS